jgi:hypothetical protein
MMRKIVLSLTLVLLAASASAQTLQDFESSFDENFQKDLAGGEGFSGTINFSSGVERPVPLVVEVTVESDKTSFATGDLRGEEFDVLTTLISTGYDWKPVVWERVQRGEGEILVPDDSVRENDSIPEAVYVSEESGFSFEDDPEVASITEDDFPGFTFVETRSELEDLDLTYDPDNTPASYVGSDFYSGEGYLPKAEAYPEDSGISGGRAREEFADGLNASDYSLMAPQSVVRGGYGEDSLPGRDAGLIESIQRPAEDTLQYSFALQERAVHTDSQNSVLIEVGADQRIKPDSFDFSFEVKSEVGVMGENETEEVRASQLEAVRAGNAGVSVNASADANVTVQTVEKVSAPEPAPESEFVGGVSVDVSNSSGEVEASGTVSINYDEDYIEENSLEEDSMQVYYYNSTKSTWTSEGIEVLERNTGENVVTAQVEHFSTYAAFAEQQEDEEDDSSGGGGSTFITPVQQEEPGNETEPQESGTEDEQSQGTPQEGGQQQPEGQNQDDQTWGRPETPVEGPPQNTPGNGITGQFLGSPTNLAGVVVALIVAMIGVLAYTGRIELEAVAERVKEKMN